MTQILTFPRDAAVAAPFHPAPGHDPLEPVPNPLPKLLTGENLPEGDSEHPFERLGPREHRPAEHHRAAVRPTCWKPLAHASICRLNERANCSTRRGSVSCSPRPIIRA